MFIVKTLILPQIIIPLLAHYMQIEYADNALLICIICANKYIICAGIIADNVRK